MPQSWRAGPTLLAAILTLLNAAKPAVVDDTAYLLFARHLAARPLDPYGFDLFWYRHPEPAMQVLLPPVVPYWLAAGITLFGEHLVLLKLWLFPFVLAMAHSVRFLLRRFARGMEADGTMLLMCSPFVLPLLGVMLDVPAIALGLAALACFIHGCDRGRWASALLAGVLAGLAMQTKYTMLALPAVLMWYGLLHRSFGKALLACVVAGGVFVGWEVLLVQKYGESHFLFHARDQGSGPTDFAELYRSKAALFQPMVNYVGGLGFVWVLVVGRALGWGNRVLVPPAVLASAGIIGVCLLPYTDSVLLKNEATQSVKLDLATLVFGSMGALVLLLSAVVAVLLVLRGRRLAFRRSPAAWFLLGWLAIELAGYFALTPFPAGRRVIGLCVILGLVACRLAGSLRRRPPPWLVAFGVALGLGVFALDWWDALAEPALADRAAKVIGNQGPKRIWTQGHWGWQYAADRHGWRLIVPGESDLRPGDILVQPVPPDDVGFYRPYHGEAKYRLELDALEPIAEFTWDDWIAGQTIPNLYGGTVPIIGRDHPRLRVVVYHVTQSWTPR